MKSEPAELVVANPENHIQTTPKNTPLYYPELDGLRFLAFLIVFVHHAPAVTYFHFQFVADFMTKLHFYGWMGVDLFLCLSAFLFTKLLFAEYQAKGEISVKNFYIRRSLRIWPLYYIFSIAMLLGTINQTGWSPLVAKNFLGLITFTDNLWVAALASYNLLWASAHLWTISYEEQFYAIIPWALRKIFRMTHNQKVLLVSSIFVLFSAARAFLIYRQTPHPIIWVLPITHFEAILGGLIVGLGLLERPLGKIPNWILLLAGIAALVGVTRLPNVNTIGWDLMLTYPLVGLGMSLVLLSFIKDSAWVLKSVIKNRLFAYLGKISYGLYVFHVLGLIYAEQISVALGITAKRFSVYPWANLGIGLALTILVAVISYQWLEKPFLRLKERFTVVHSRPI